MIRALVFDFDGLILETEEPIFQSWQEIYRAYGRQLLLEDWAAIIGTMDASFDPLEDLDQQLGGKLDREQIILKRGQREAELILAQPILPGVQEYLDDAKRLGLKIGLASSSPCDWVTGHLSRLGLLDYFDCVRGGDEVTLTKPDPSLYLLTVECLGVPAAQAVAFEDSPNGILAAKRAGLFCVAVPNVLTRRLLIDNADMRLESLADLSLGELLRDIELAQDGFKKYP